MNPPGILRPQAAGDLARRAVPQAGEDRFRALIEKSADAIVVLSERGTVLHANPPAEQLFGLQREAFVGRNLGLPLAPAGTAEVEVLGGDGKLTLCELRLIESAWAGVPAWLAALREDSIDTTLVGWTPLGHLELLRKRARRPLVGPDAVPKPRN